MFLAWAASYVYSVLPIRPHRKQMLSLKACKLVVDGCVARAWWAGNPGSLPPLYFHKGAVWGIGCIKYALPAAHMAARAWYMLCDPHGLTGSKYYAGNHIARHCWATHIWLHSKASPWFVPLNICCCSPIWECNKNICLSRTESKFCGPKKQPGLEPPCSLSESLVLSSRTIDLRPRVPAYCVWLFFRLRLFVCKIQIYEFLFDL